MHCNSGLRGQHLETIPSNTESSSTSPGEHSSPQMIPEIIPSPQKKIDHSLDVESPPPLLPTETSEDHPDVQPEEEEGGQDLSEEEHEDETCFSRDEEADDCEENDEDFEEVVVKPRTLNEVTSLTDKTSPWTSILSDPDLASVESMEALKESDLSEGEDKIRQVVHLDTHESAGKPQESDHHHCSDRSTGDASESEGDYEMTLQGDDETQAGMSDELNIPNNTSDDPASSPTTEPAVCTCSVSASPNNEDTQLQLYP